MDRLNCFKPYRSKHDFHEDQLSRNFLVLLRLSFHAFSIFYDQCRESYNASRDKSVKPLPILSDLFSEGWLIETQRGNPQINTNLLLSVLITDKQMPITEIEQITPLERTARYDGVVTFGDSLTMVIENKPRSESVWFDQLKPSSDGLSEETQTLTKPAVLEWKEIVRKLSQSLSLSNLNGSEKMLVEDFLAYVDETYPFLNPYDSLGLCKGNAELINRRIETLLHFIVKDPETVRYHTGWGRYIAVPYTEVQQIGLLQGRDDVRWHLELSFSFGDSQSQARAFYERDIDLTHLDSAHWVVRPNFHVSFRNSNLVWFSSPDTQRYLDYWGKNKEMIRQLKRAEVKGFLLKLEERGIITIGSRDEEEMERRFYRTKMTTLNICPSLSLASVFDDTSAESLDKEGVLSKTIQSRIIEALKVSGRDGAEFLSIIRGGRP